MDGTARERPTEATRAEILHHAEELFTHYGFWKTNVGDIATCCGTPPHSRNGGRGRRYCPNYARSSTWSSMA